ncbi:MAG: hypothetical protein ACKO7B_11855, partial [Flavobacteriales bacterium]
IIGSGSIEAAGDGSMMDVNSVQLLVNRRKKRVFDVAASVVLLVFSPALILPQKRPARFLPNIIKVLLGSATLVGYASSAEQRMQLPKMKPGILPTTRHTDETHRRKLDVLYAKDYRMASDARIVFAQLAFLGE